MEGLDGVGPGCRSRDSSGDWGACDHRFGKGFVMECAGMLGSGGAYVDSFRRWEIVKVVIFDEILKLVWGCCVVICIDWANVG